MAHLLEWLRGSALAYGLFGPPAPRDVTQHPYATATTPDEIITEALLLKMASGIDQWSRSHPTQYQWRITGPDATLDYSSRPDEFRINGIPFETSVGIKLKDQFERLRNAYDAAQAAAHRALLEMEANERKWDMAEKMLGLKRNEFGALVPIRTAE